MRIKILILSLQEARESLKYYKNCKGQTPDETNAIEMELQRLQKVSLQSENKNRLTFKEFRNPPIYRGIIIGMVLATLNQLCGCFTFMTYGVKIFEESGTHIDPQLANITLGVLQCTGNLCTTQLVDKIGRRLLLVISVSGAALGLSTMAIFSYLDYNGFDLSVLHWIPVASLGFVIFISSVGVVPLTLICVVESLPNEVSFVFNISIRHSFCVYLFSGTSIRFDCKRRDNLYDGIRINQIISDSLGNDSFVWLHDNLCGRMCFWNCISLTVLQRDQRH